MLPLHPTRAQVLLAGTVSHPDQSAVPTEKNVTMLLIGDIAALRWSPAPMCGVEAAPTSPCVVWTVSPCWSDVPVDLTGPLGPVAVCGPSSGDSQSWIVKERNTAEVICEAVHHGAVWGIITKQGNRMRCVCAFCAVGCVCCNTHTPHVLSLSTTGEDM